MGVCKCLVWLMVGLVLTMSLAESQSSSNSCAQSLIPCADYINSPNPPKTCCDPLKETVAKELTCLCNLFYTPGLLQSFNITVNQALTLSQRCGVTSDLSSCKNGSAPAPASGVTPPATAGGDKGGAGRVAFTGLSFVLLFLVSMLFN